MIYLEKIIKIIILSKMYVYIVNLYCDQSSIEKVFYKKEDAISYAKRRMEEIYYESYSIRKKYKNQKYVIEDIALGEEHIRVKISFETCISDQYFDIFCYNVE